MENGDDILINSGENTGSDSTVKPLKDEPKIEKISQDQFYDIITTNDVSWQSIIYELIQSEQLDPWDIDIAVLANRYLLKIREMEEANFFISSKVLLAASLLVRIKSELLLNDYLKSIDDILFGKKEEKKYEQERITLDDDELPELIPRTPLPRFRHVTLQELMSALNKAISTENRRIKREIVTRRAEKLSKVDFETEKNKVSVRDRIRHLYAKIRTFFNKQQQEKLGFTELVGNGKQEKIAGFLPILHLENQKKVYLNQEKHFDEIWIWLYDVYMKQNTIDDLEKEIEVVEKELEVEFDDEQKKRIEQINDDFENPLSDIIDDAEKND